MNEGNRSLKSAAVTLALLVSAAAPAAAQDSGQGRTSTTDTGTTETIGTGTDKVICKREKVSGSRVTAKRVCQTAAQWERQRREDQMMAEKIQGARWKS